MTSIRLSLILFFISACSPMASLDQINLVFDTTLEREQTIRTAAAIIEPLGFEVFVPDAMTVTIKFTENLPSGVLGRAMFDDRVILIADDLDGWEGFSAVIAHELGHVFLQTHEHAEPPALMDDGLRSFELTERDFRFVCLKAGKGC